MQNTQVGSNKDVSLVASVHSKNNFTRFSLAKIATTLVSYHRPRSRGDNTFGSVCPSVRRSTLSHLNGLTYFSTGAEWPTVVLGFANYSKNFNEAQIRYTLKNIIATECNLKGRSKWLCMESVVVSTGWAFAVDHPFNFTWS